MARNRQPKLPIDRTRDGFVLNLQDEERELVARLLGEMRQLLLTDADPTMLRRLFPPAYHLADDAEADAEYQRLMRDELVASRLAAINEVETLLTTRAAMTDEDVVAFMQAINGLRLVLGTLLDVGEDTDPGEVDDDDPLIGEHHLYGYLSYLLDASVQALSSPGT